MEIENVVYKGGANHFVGVESVGGHLYLTPDALIFVSHSINIQTHQMSIPLADIVGIEPRKTLGIVPNGISIHTAAGTDEKFVVNKRKVWIEKINELRSNK